MRRTPRLLTFVAALALVLLAPATALSHEGSVKQPAQDLPLSTVEDAEHSDNLAFITNLEFPTNVEGGSFNATDLDFHTYRFDGDDRGLPRQARVPGGLPPQARDGGGQERDFAFVGTALNGMQVVDITDRENPELVAVYDCRISQADVFVFEQGDRVLAAYSLDAVSQNQPEGSACHEDNEVTDDTRGTFLIDITDPYEPESAGFLPMRKGSHQVTVHPSGEYVYNSAAVVVTDRWGSIEVWDIGDQATPGEPELVDEIELLTGLDSHDGTFNEDGTRFYSAALTHSFVIDTSDPRNNEILGRIYDPAINIHHDAHQVSVDTPFGERDYLLLGDELAGAIGTGTCPGGGVHVYDITGELEAAPVKVGAFFIPEVRIEPDPDASPLAQPTCTAHVLDIQEEEQLISIAWYNAGVRILDYSGLENLGPTGLSVGIAPFLGGSLTPGIQEVGHYRFPDSNLWSAKVPEVEEDGSFYIYGGDINRHLDVFRFDAGQAPQADGGQWVAPARALELAPITGTAMPDEGGSDTWKQLLTAGTG